LFLKTLDWSLTSPETGVIITLSSTPSEEPNIYRSLFFYRLVDTLADKLKPLCVPYFNYFLDDCVRILSTAYCDNHPTTNAEDNQLSKKKKQGTKVEKKNNELNRVYDELVNYVIQSLHKAFLYEGRGGSGGSVQGGLLIGEFVHKGKNLDKLLVPLVNQLERTRPGNGLFGTSMETENTDSLETYRKKADLLIPCLAQLAVTLGNDKLWKNLNYQILLKTRSRFALVRYASLGVLENIYSRLGDEYIILVPETVPFLAELLEDPDPNVEARVRSLISTINIYLGDEKIEDYF